MTGSTAWLVRLWLLFWYCADYWFIDLFLYCSVVWPARLFMFPLWLCMYCVVDYVGVLHLYHFIFILHICCHFPLFCPFTLASLDFLRVCCSPTNDVPWGHISQRSSFLHVVLYEVLAGDPFGVLEGDRSPLQIRDLYICIINCWFKTFINIWTIWLYITVIIKQYPRVQF